jgi:hypothetical protein
MYTGTAVYRNETLMSKKAPLFAALYLHVQAAKIWSKLTEVAVIAVLADKGKDGRTSSMAAKNVVFFTILASCCTLKGLDHEIEFIY